MRGFRALLFLTMIGAAQAGDPGCDGNPGITGRCYWVHGTVALSADRGFVLFGNGKHRSLIIRNPPQGSQDMPENLIHAIDKAQRRAGVVSAEVRGVFKVCPIPADQVGENVCIARAIRLKTSGKRTGAP